MCVCRVPGEQSQTSSDPGSWEVPLFGFCASYGRFSEDPRPESIRGVLPGRSPDLVDEGQRTHRGLQVGGVGRLAPVGLNEDVLMCPLVNLTEMICVFADRC